MTLSTDELRALDRLLDQALELAPSERARWLEAIASEHANLAPTLRELLTRDAEFATTQLFGRPPPLSHLLGDAPAADSPEGMLEAGVSIGPYRLVRELGAGGMGTVWLAERIDGLIKRPVALKLPLFSVHNRGLVERFARERAILASLTHPNIARLYDAGVTGAGQPYLALEYVEGKPLIAWCDERHASIRERIGLFVQVLRAVQYAHANLVIHRDLKPSNILVTRDGEVRLLDFGIAKLVTDGEANETELTRLAGRALTPSYAAPELLAGTAVNITSDVYSLGVIFYELVSGARPYRPRDDSRASLEQAILHDDVVRASAVVTEASATQRGLANARKLASALTGDLDTIALKALKKRPEERYATAAAYAEDLERHLRGDAIEARADSALYRTAKLVARHRVVFGATGVIAIALVAGASVALWQASEARREAALAHAVQEFVLDLFRVNSADQPDPVRARQTTARELLDRGSARITQSLRDQPKARLELLATLSDLYRELGLWAKANDLAAQRVELTRSLYGPDDLRVAEALGDKVIKSLHHRESASPEDLDSMIREALRIHDAHGDKASLARTRLHVQASVIYVDQLVPAAIEHASRAVELYRSRYPTDREFPHALSMLGTALLRSGSDWDGALAAQEEALRIARAQVLPEHLLLYFIRRAGEVNSVLGRAEEADELLREALAMSERVNGEKHSVTVVIRRAIARNLASMSRFDEAAEIAARTIADTMSGAGGETYLVRDNHRMLFDVHWGRGDVAAASRGSAAALATFGPSTPVSFEHADLLIQGAAIDSVYGLHAQALAKLSRAADVARHARIAQTSRFFTNLALREARARIGVGEALRARALLEEQLDTLRAGPGVARQRAVLNAVLVDAFIALGDIAQAYRAAEQAERELAREPRRANLVNVDAQVERAMGQAAMAEGAFDRALPHLERAAALYRSIHLPESPFRAEAEALRAACLARLGRRDEALAALALARVAQAKHGKFGEDFTRLLHQAEMLAQAAAAPVARSSSR